MNIIEIIDDLEARLGRKLTQEEQHGLVDFSALFLRLGDEIYTRKPIEFTLAFRYSVGDR